MTTPIKLMMDYTLFHIGAYITLSTLLLTLLALDPLKRKERLKRKGLHWLLLGTLILFMIAGACGGVIASTLPHLKEGPAWWLTNAGPTPFRRLMPLDWWATIEHFAFWAGIVVAVSAVWWVTRPEDQLSALPAEEIPNVRLLANACWEMSNRVVAPEPAADLRVIGESLIKMAEKSETQHASSSQPSSPSSDPVAAAAPTPTATNLAARSRIWMLRVWQSYFTVSPRR